MADPIGKIVLESRRLKKPKKILHNRIYVERKSNVSKDGLRRFIHYSCSFEGCKAKLISTITIDSGTEELAGGNDHISMCVGDVAEIKRQQARVFLYELVAFENVSLLGAIDVTISYLEKLIGDRETAIFRQTITNDSNLTAKKICRDFFGRTPQTNFSELALYVIPTLLCIEYVFCLVWC